MPFRRLPSGERFLFTLFLVGMAASVALAEMLRAHNEGQSQREIYFAATAVVCIGLAGAFARRDGNDAADSEDVDGSL